MPVNTADHEEHAAVRTGVGVFDVSHMGSSTFADPVRWHFFSAVTVNDVSKLSEGNGAIFRHANHRAALSTIFSVYHCATTICWSSCFNIAKDFAWLQKNLTPDVQLRDDSDRTSLLPSRAQRRWRPFAASDKCAAPQRSRITTFGAVASQDTMRSYRGTGYTGELGFELYFDSRSRWQGDLGRGVSFGRIRHQPVGLGARDTLRLEMGFLPYGNDIRDTTTPGSRQDGVDQRVGKRRILLENRYVFWTPEKEEAGLPKRLVGLALRKRTSRATGYPDHRRHEGRKGFVSPPPPRQRNLFTDAGSVRSPWRNVSRREPNAERRYRWMIRAKAVRRRNQLPFVSRYSDLSHNGRREICVSDSVSTPHNWILS